MLSVIAELVSTISDWLSTWGYLGVFVAAVGIFPAEIVMTIVGAVRPEFISLVKIGVAGALGEVVGAAFTYLVGYYFRNKDIIGYLNGKGKWLKVDGDSFMKTHKKFKAKGFLYIILTRFTPWLRIVVLLVAGYLEYNFFLASLGVFIGTFVYAFGFAYLGSKIGFDLAKITDAINTVNNWLVILTLLVVGIIIYLNRKKVKEFIVGIIKGKEKE
ncbi:MAG TPA: VTT domain-containing protein [Candidatus Dojkabacteria bacterium]|nr:VTT domain-containing protein [Candidatus Dojkabacteria bacterium]